MMVYCPRHLRLGSDNCLNKLEVCLLKALDHKVIENPKSSLESTWKLCCTSWIVILPASRVDHVRFRLLELRRSY
jgi:hypothetical protein